LKPPSKVVEVIAISKSALSRSRKFS